MLRSHRASLANMAGTAFTRLFRRLSRRHRCPDRSPQRDVLPANAYFTRTAVHCVAFVAPNQVAPVLPPAVARCASNSWHRFAPPLDNFSPHNVRSPLSCWGQGRKALQACTSSHPGRSWTAAAGRERPESGRNQSHRAFEPPGSVGCLQAATMRDDLIPWWPSSQTSVDTLI